MIVFPSPAGCTPPLETQHGRVSVFGYDDKSKLIIRKVWFPVWTGVKHPLRLHVWSQRLCVKIHSWFSKMCDWTHGLFCSGCLGLADLPDRRRRSAALSHVSCTVQGRGLLPLLERIRLLFTQRATSDMCTAVSAAIKFSKKPKSPAHLMVQDELGHSFNHVLQWDAAQGSTTGRTELLNTFLQIGPENRFFFQMITQRICDDFWTARDFNWIYSVWSGNMVASCSMALSNTVLPGCCRRLSGGLCCCSCAEAAPASAADGWAYGELREHEGRGLPRSPLSCNSNRETLGWTVDGKRSRLQKLEKRWCTDSLLECQTRWWCQLKADRRVFCHRSSDQSAPGTESVDQRWVSVNNQD